MMKRNILLHLLLALGVPVWGQSFSYQAPVDSVRQAGYYRIQLSPSVQSLAQEDLADLRLRGADGQDVPYIAERPATPGGRPVWVPLPFTVDTRPSQTVLVIDRDTHRHVDPVLRLANADVQKRYSVEGSAEGTQWYSVRAADLLNPAAGSGSALRELPLYLPETPYRYIRLRISDSTAAPVQIQAVGFYRQTKGASTAWVSLGSCPGADRPKHRAGTTRWELLYVHTTRADMLEFEFEPGPAYRRPFRIAYTTSRTYRRHTYTDTVTLTEGVFESGQNPLQVRIPRIARFSLLLLVDDGDSPPLTLKAVRAYQYPVYLVAYLKPGQRYQVFFGAQNVHPPRYDIAELRNSLNIRPELLQMGLYTERAEVAATTTNMSAARKQLFLWGGLIVLALFLGFMAYRLLQDTPGGSSGGAGS